MEPGRVAVGDPVELEPGGLDQCSYRGTTQGYAFC